MKKISTILIITLMVLSVFSGCNKPAAQPSASPNVPIVSESPAIPSPDLDMSPMPDDDDDTLDPIESAEPDESPAATVTP